MDKLYHIDDAFFAELKTIWENGLPEKPYHRHDIVMIIQFIEEKIGIDNTHTPKLLLLYGREGGPEIVERLMGVLVAIAPGIVILSSANNELSGLLEHSTKNKNSFDLRALCNFKSLEIHNPRNTDLFPMKDFPMVIEWDENREWYDTYGIDSARWGVMKPWLDKWLPE